MKKYLREKFTHSVFWKRDCHCKKDSLVNWWETFNNVIGRRTSKQILKRELENETL